MTFIKHCGIKNNLPDLDDLIETHLPCTFGVLRRNDLAESIYLWLDSYDRGDCEGDFMSAIQVTREYEQNLRTSFTGLKEVMNAKLGQIFDTKTDDEIMAMFPLQNVPRENYLAFVAFARESYGRGHAEISGRFDFSIDPETGDVFVYEYNGGTPATLFESTVLQDIIGKETPNPLGWKSTVHFPTKLMGKNIAIVVGDTFEEDLATAETVGNVLSQVRRTTSFMVTPENFRFNPDHVYAEDNPYSPFFDADAPTIKFSGAYCMIPWEELMMGDFILRWKEWDSEMHFLVPAHAWFYNHKAFLTLLDEATLKELKPDLDLQPVKIRIESYRTPQSFGGARYVRKPMLGRCSASITIWEKGRQVEQSDCKELDDGDYVYQPFVECPLLGGFRVMGTMLCTDMFATTLGFRAFSGHILDVTDETVLPYVFAD